MRGGGIAVLTCIALPSVTSANDHIIVVVDSGEVGNRLSCLSCLLHSLAQQVLRLRTDYFCPTLIGLSTPYRCKAVTNRHMSLLTDHNNNCSQGYAFHRASLLLREITS